jgi:hypothetical protein
MKNHREPMPEPLAPDSYGPFLVDLKGRIRNAQLRASMAVNRELVMLYWRIGSDILDRQHRENWGAKVIDRLLHKFRGAGREKPSQTSNAPCQRRNPTSRGISPEILTTSIFSLSAMLTSAIWSGAC